jgi:hypothetical protein
VALSLVGKFVFTERVSYAAGDFVSWSEQVEVVERVWPLLLVALGLGLVGKFVFIERVSYAAGDFVSWPEQVEVVERVWLAVSGLWLWV